MISWKEVLTRYSTWVVFIVTGIAYYWLQLPAAEQAALQAAYPWLKHAAPLAALVAFLVARAKAQPPQPPKETPDDPS